jgi:hypothetical protein
VTEMLTFVGVFGLGAILAFAIVTFAVCAPGAALRREGIEGSPKRVAMVGDGQSLVRRHESQAESGDVIVVRSEWRHALCRATRAVKR